MFKKLLYSNFRFLYRISQIGKHRLTSTGFLITGTMIASAIFGIDIRQSMAFQIFAITSALLITAILASFRFRSKFEVSRILPDFATVDQNIKYKIKITNLSTQTEKELLVFDDLETKLPKFPEFQRSTDPQDKNRNRFDRIVGYPRLMNLIRIRQGAKITPASVPQLRGMETSTFEIELHPLRRGYINFCNGYISRSDPLDLFRGLKEFRQNDKLLVLPKTYKTPIVQVQGMRKYQHGGINQASAIGDSQEFMSLREYRPGDPLRAIHWKSYAKLGTPVVKEFHDEFFVRQGLLLDTFQEEKSDLIFEEAISVAASFCLHLPTTESLLDLMFVGDKAYRFTSGRGLGHVDNMLEVLACTKACRNDTFSSLIEQVPIHSGETSALICVLLDWDDKRKTLIEFILKSGIPVIVFLIIDSEQDDSTLELPAQLNPNQFIPLRTGDVQSNLQQLGEIVLTAND